MSMMWMLLFVSAISGAESAGLRFDRNGKPDSSREFIGCKVCNYMYSYVDGDKNFYPSETMTTLEERTQFSQERRDLVTSSTFQRLVDKCQHVENISDRHRTGTCANIVRHFFLDPIKVALCVGNTQDDPGMDSTFFSSSCLTFSFEHRLSLFSFHVDHIRTVLTTITFVPFV